MPNARRWVGEGFKAAKENLSVVFLFWAVSLPYFIYSVLVKHQASEKPSLPTLLALPILLVLFVIYLILWIGLIHYLKVKREGEEATLGTLWKGGLLYFWRYVGQHCLLFGFLFLLFLGTAIPFLLLLISRTTVIVLISVLLALLIFGVGFYFFLLASGFSAIILVVESEGILNAIKKSISFTRPRLGMLMRLWFLLFLLGLGLILVAGLGTAVFAALGMGRGMVEGIVSIVLGLPEMFIGIVSTSTLIYFYLAESKPKGETPATGISTPS